MGYIPELYRILNNSAVPDSYDDQLYYTEIFLDKQLRHELNIKIDSCAEIFQCFSGRTPTSLQDEMEIIFEGKL